MIAADMTARRALVVLPSKVPSPIIPIEIGFIIALLIFYQCVQLATATFPDAFYFGNLLGPIALMLIMGFGAITALHRDPSTIWGALFWFRVATAVYFGIGNLVALSTDEATALHLKGFYYFSDAETFKFNVIIAFSLFFVFIGAMLTTYTFGLTEKYKPIVTIYPVMMFFLFAGGFARYGVVLPFLLNVQDSVIPSIVSVLAKAYTAGLMILVVIALTRQGIYIAVAFTLIIIEIAVGIIIFNKSDVILTCLCVTIALYSYREKLITLIIALSVTFFILSIIIPIVAYGRNTLARDRGNQSATIEDRIALIQNYRGEMEVMQSQDTPSGLSRFSYVNVATFVVSRYDAGLPTETLANTAAVFIPRFLWPEKPDLTYHGRELYTEATGQEGTLVTPGVFAEVYGNFGWWGIPWIMTGYGMMLSLISRAMSAAMARREWALLPVALLGILIGVRVDGSVVVDLIGAPVTLGIFAAIIIAVTRGPIKA